MLPRRARILVKKVGERRVHAIPRSATANLDVHLGVLWIQVITKMLAKMTPKWRLNHVVLSAGADWSHAGDGSSPFSAVGCSLEERWTCDLVC